MRNNNYKDNRKWSDDVMPQVMGIFLHLMPEDAGWHIKETSKKIDMTEAADLILFNTITGVECRIGSRVRDSYALDQWPNEFTIRHAYTAGHKTEYTKVGEDGHCDMNFYGFVVNGIIVRWVIIDFNEFRNQHEFVDGVLVPMPHLRYSLQHNADGKNDFFAYDINSFKNLDKLIVTASPGYLTDIIEKNYPGLPPVYIAKPKEQRVDF